MAELAFAGNDLRLGWSVDTEKCFENVHPRLVLHVLQLWGLSEEISGPLGHMWLHHARWLSVGGQ
eukprot:2531162-Alexandrium_andersonii.AAC.1